MGAFKTSLPQWVISADSDAMFTASDNKGVSSPGSLSGTAQFSWENFKINPSILDSVMAVDVTSNSVDYDQFLIQSFFDVKVARNLDRNGLPY